MAADDFFKRWAKPKATLPEVPAAPADLASSGPQEIPAAGAATDHPLPTLEDVAKLHRDSDFSPFLAKGVDESVLRSAMKKLFSDPHFNLMDGLDTYIDDYNKFEPIPPEMLALLNHAKGLLNPLAQLEQPAIGSTRPIPVAEQQAAAPGFEKTRIDAPVETPVPPSADAGAPEHQEQTSAHPAPAAAGTTERDRRNES